MTLRAIEVREVGKRYWKVQERSLVRSLVPFGPPNRTRLWALRDVNLQVEQGETIGIIGRNGAGKSTLLRLLAGVSQPTSGTVITRGRIAPLLSVGVGFHREMTGRENIYVNGMLLGLTKPHIKHLFDDIVDFADLGEFIDTPVKFYSSGMFMRLGFSVAVHANPDVLLVDEVLAVGDTGFRLRSFERMRALQRSGTTLVFVSQWIGAIHMFCPRAVCMHNGQVEFDGPADEAIARYHDLWVGATNGTVGDVVTVVRRELLGADGQPVGTTYQDDVLTYRVTLRFERPVESPQVLFQALSEDGTAVYGRRTTVGESWRSFSAGEETPIVVKFQPRFGGGGTFKLVLMVSDNEVTETLVHDHDGPSFFVAPRADVSGVTDLNATIAIGGEDRSKHRSLRFEDHPAVVEGG
jgi:ABC-2 type transport system ATP-binding protein